MRQLTLDIPAIAPEQTENQNRTMATLMRTALQAIMVHVGMPLAGVKVSVEGSLPAQGPFVLAVNHNSHLDTPVVLSLLTREQRKALRIAASHRYFFETRRLLRRAAVHLFGLIPATGRALINTAHRIRTERSILLIYPEGTRSRNGEMGQFQYGIGMLHRESGVPVVPVNIQGTGTLMPAGRWFPRRGTITVSIGTPLTIDIADANTITATVEQKVRALAE